MTLPENKATRLQTTFILMQAFTSGFTHIYIWRLQENIIYLAYYDLIYYIFTAAAYLFAGYVLRKLSVRKTLIIATIFFIAGYSMVPILKEGIVDYLLLFALLKGIGNGLYWASYNILELEVSRDMKREQYLGKIAGNAAMVGMAVPIISGYIITRYSTGSEYLGYYILFTLSIGVSFYLIYLATKVRNIKFSHYRLRDVIRVGSSKEFRPISLIGLINGFTGVGKYFISVILSYFILGSEFALGAFASIFGFLNGIYNYKISTRLNPKNRVLTSFLGSTLVVAGEIIFITFLNFSSMIIRQVSGIIGTPLMSLSETSILFRFMQKHSHYRSDAELEHLAANDIFLGVGRIGGIAAFIIFLQIFGNNNFNAVRFWFFILSLSPFLVWWLHKKVQVETKEIK